MASSVPSSVAHPGHDRPVVEADDELHRHLDAPAHALDDADEVGLRLAGRHEVDEAHGAVVGLEFRLEDERVAAVLSSCRAELARGLDRPVAVLRVAEERGEQRSRVEARQAEPVDRAVAADERGGLQIADEPVVLDRRAIDRRFLKEVTPETRPPEALPRSSVERRPVLVSSALSSSVAAYVSRMSWSRSPIASTTSW